MTNALLIISTFHIVLWISIAVLSALEPPRPVRKLELVATTGAGTPEGPAAVSDSGREASSLQEAA